MSCPESFFFDNGGVKSWSPLSSCKGCSRLMPSSLASQCCMCDASEYLYSRRVYLRSSFQESAEIVSCHSMITYSERN